MVAAHHVSRRVLTLAILIGVAAALAVYYLVGPDSGMYPRCLFRQLTGLDCPGCGSQRAIHALLHGHIAEAWGHNALLLIELPLIGLLLAARAMRPRHPRLDLLLNSRAMILLLLVTIILWTIVRNILAI